jgi:hypothetical protein
MTSTIFQFHLRFNLSSDSQQTLQRIVDGWFPLMSSLSNNQPLYYYNQQMLGDLVGDILKIYLYMFEIDAGFVELL